LLLPPLLRSFTVPDREVSGRLRRNPIPFETLQAVDVRGIELKVITEGWTYARLSSILIEPGVR
jgi:hypothetical protein